MQPCELTWTRLGFRYSAQTPRGWTKAETLCVGKGKGNVCYLKGPILCIKAVNRGLNILFSGETEFLNNQFYKAGLEEIGMKNKMGIIWNHNAITQL